MLNMLTGFLEPSGGTARLAGLDIKDDMRQVYKVRPTLSRSTLSNSLHPLCLMAHWPNIKDDMRQVCKVGGMADNRARRGNRRCQGLVASLTLPHLPDVKIKDDMRQGEAHTFPVHTFQ